MPDRLSETVHALASDFAERLVAAAERAMAARLYAAVGAAAVPRPRRPGRPPSSASGALPRRRAMRVSPARRRQMQAQGRYISTLRRLKAADRTKIQAIAKRDGVRAALKAAAKMR